MASTFLLFETTAKRLAYVFRERHVGRYVYDREDQHWYGVSAAGSGSGVMSQLDGATLAYGSPAALTVGGSNTDGVATSVARSDHKHALPAFGSGAGTFCEGNDSRLSNDRTASGLRTASTVVSVSAATAPTAGQVLTATSSTAATWQTPGGGGGGSTIWDARVIPTGLHADSDEFLVDSIADWASWDPGGYITTTIEIADGEQHMRFEGTGSGGIQFGGRYKDVPSDEFTFLAYVANDGLVNTNAPLGGLLVGEDLAGAPTTSDFVTNEFVTRRNNDANHGAVTGRTSTVYTSAGTQQDRLLDGPTGLWVLAGVQITPATPTADVHCYFTTDGRYWTFVSTRTVAYAPQHYGLVFQQTAAQAASMVVKHFRVFDGTSDPRDIINGGYI
jgi:hypothetical protein